MNAADVWTKAGVSPADTLPMWTPIPDGTDPSGAWAKSVARGLVEDLALEDDAVPGLASYFEAVRNLERPERFPLRLVFFLGPAFKPLIWDVAFLTPDADTTAVGLVRLGPEGQVGHSEQTFEWNDIQGAQVTSYDLDDESADDERAIAGRSAVAVVRDLPGLGNTAVYAQAQTAYLDSLAISSIPMQYLITSDALAELVANP